MASKFENDLTKGNVWKQLIMFSLPFIVSNLIQTLYNVADMIIVGQFSGMVSMSGVNIGGQITVLITNMVVGLSTGATVLIGQYMGYGAKREIKETIGTLFTTLLVLAVAITVVMLAVRNPLLKLIQTPPESYSEALSYFTVTMLGTIFIFGYNALSAVMRGMGDSKNPLIFVAVACVVNIFLDLLLVAVFKMGAMGAAIATVVSQAFSMIACIVYLKKNKFVFDFNLNSFGFNKERLKMLLKVGIPTSVQNLVTGISFLILTAMVNTIGVTASAAVGAVGKFNGFGILPSVAISASVSAMAAQNLGANKEKRAVETVKAGVIMSFSIGLLIFAFSMLFPETVMRIFANDKDMITEGVKYIRTFSFDYIFVSFVFCINGIFIASGHTVFSLTISMLSSLLFRVPFAYLFGFVMDMGLAGVGLGAPVASFVCLIIDVISFKKGIWKKQVIVKH